MERFELTDAQWAQLEPRLPPEKPRTGRPNHSHRRILNGILWINRTGAPWKDLPDHYGPVGTVSSRFYRWRRAGVWQRTLEALQARADRQGRVDWSLHFLDSTIVRAHQHAAGARKVEWCSDDEALGRSRGGYSTKFHVRAEGLGKPVTFWLTGGEVHDSKAFARLMGTGWTKRLGRGRPRLKPDRLAADKAYSSGAIRLALRRRGIQSVLPTKSNERPAATFDRDAYRERNRVERLINKLKQYRRIATRHEKRAVNYLAMITIAAILLWL
ncbi:IS5 family transposase [Azospirillum canadense]|uniref:IS5 family transposase n=1 Tax=Azospirillum canadense TaxID=403962 RepID=UPI002227F59F|nr:IS5 family transposase [Azospirillum canadense]MCW2241862.1 transposase [Azospirillum canadense]